ncbi:MAG: histidine ammonia-lyase [Candidatus Hatepunaea meridiana]|nr:histidine ammonia-lyase [Candidatus Hatepunaea meridiana]
MTLQIDGYNLTIDQVAEVARDHIEVELSPEAIEKINASATFIKKLVDKGTAIYGVTTGIGEFARIKISPEMGSELQRRIIYSHAAGTGDPFPEEVVRSAMLLRANTLCRGYSGVRCLIPQVLIDMVNKGVTPVVCEKGSVGTSGDLSPLSQMALVCLGEGEAFYKGERMHGGKAMEKAGIKTIELSFKEGLGLINGSQMATGGSALLLVDARNLIKNAFIASAMSIDALKGVQGAYDARLHAVRPFHGQNLVACHLRTLMAGSEVIADGSGKVQDGYSMRCTPQVYGPTVDAWLYVHNQVETEVNSTADNPLFFTDDETYLAGGNFHSQNIALAMDFLAIAMSEIAGLSERHTNRLMNPVLSGLPDFLVEGKGLNSGLMVAQYTAAALVSENKVLSHPAVVDSISVSADQEDHVAMTPIAVRKCKEILQNVGAVLAIEMMSAAQAFDFHKPLIPGKGTRVAYQKIRELVPFLVDDRVLYPDIEKIVSLVRDGSLVKAVEEEVGELYLKA